MRLSVRFPITNTVYVRNPFPVTVGKADYFIEAENERAQSVSVTWRGLATEAAYKIETGNGFPIITGGQGSYVLAAEHDLRAWQSIMTPYVLIDIDFDNPTISFKAEAPEEEPRILITEFSTNRTPQRRRGTEAFEVFGRAFLALEEGKPLIEVMSLYREATRAQQAGRSIDAYNGFYLFFETQYCRGRTGTDAATAELMKSSEFMKALGATVQMLRGHKNYAKLRFKSMSHWDTDPRSLVKEIVELRGHLRHHSLSSPKRWDPNNQEQFDLEARFLGMTAHDVAFPKTTSITCQDRYVKVFNEMAEAMHQTVEIAVTVTIREGDHASDQYFAMTIPQSGFDPALARVVLTKTLEIVEDKAPGAEIFAIRARHKRHGTELFRYDIGPTIAR